MRSGNRMKEAIEQLLNAEYCTAFTGAGVSTFSGIRDFRGQNGLYNEKDSEKIFDFDYFMSDPSFYYSKTKDFIYNVESKVPGLVHETLASLENRGIVKTIITQNIDMLHQRAGSKNVIEVHGSPSVHTCLDCGKNYTYEVVSEIVQNNITPVCKSCGGYIKPEITFFGEPLPVAAIEAAFEEAEKSDLMLVLGSSLVVQPAASIPLAAVKKGGVLFIINDMATPLDEYAQECFPDLETFCRAVQAAL